MESWPTKAHQEEEPGGSGEAGVTGAEPSRRLYMTPAGATHTPAQMNSLQSSIVVCDQMDNELV